MTKPKEITKASPPIKRAAIQSGVMSPKKSVEPKSTSPQAKTVKPTSPPAKTVKPTSPPAKTVPVVAPVGFSPRRSSRSRKATEKGKNIFDIFESKDSKEVTPARGAEEVSGKVEESRTQKKVVEESRTHRGKILSERIEVERMEEDNKEVKCFSVHF